MIDLAPTRVRHETRFRLLEVTRVESLSPAMRRITLAGDMAGFTSPGFDDHVKLFFPAPGEDAPPTPQPGPNGSTFPEGRRPTARDFTPRAHDLARGELTLDFALHEAGPATEWAAQAAPGRKLGVGGPRGSFLLPTGYDWHLLAGDETALPAIARRLEELPATTRAIVLAEIAAPGHEIPLATDAQLDLRWLPRTATGLEQALADLTLPPGEGYAWVVCESDLARRLRALLTGPHGLAKDRVKAAGYWKRGAVATHETHGD